MSLLRLEIDPDKFRKFGLKKRQLNNAVKESLAAMGSYWWLEYLPLHFQESAYTRYSYSRRRGMGLDPQGRAFQRSYAGTKQRLKRHNKPLVFTGEGYREAIGVLRMQSTSKEARVALPSKFNFKNRKSRISMRDELTRIIPSEAKQLVEVGRRQLRISIARPPSSSS